MSFSPLTNELYEKLAIYYKKYESVDHIWREECVVCFDNPQNSSNVYYICLSTYIGFCQHHLPLYLEENKKFFISVHRTKICFEPPSKIPVKLATGVEGGFDHFTRDKFNQIFSLVVADRSQITVIQGDPGFLPNDINTIIQTGLFSMSRGFVVPTFTNPDIPISMYAQNLFQIPNPPPFSNENLKCNECDLTTGLWLNLSDGRILCGRSYYDGSGGNNHSPQHYEKTKYPLAVKITSLDAVSAEIYSYAEDKLVTDPWLDSHLQHLNVNRKSLCRVEKTILEQEIEMNLSIKGDYDTILERGKHLQPLFGPGYTGILNIGNTCYIASVLQVLFSFREIVQIFLKFNFPHDFLKSSWSSLVGNIVFQICKLNKGLYSGKYSSPVLDENGEPMKEVGGIRPLMLKKAITDHHDMFKGYNQQDACEFFMYFCDLMTKYEKTSNLACAFENMFDFKICETFYLVESPSNIQDLYCDEKILRINVPDDLSIEAVGENVESTEKSRYCIPWKWCMEQLVKPYTLDSMEINGVRGVANRVTRFCSLPMYLVVQICRFTYNVKTCSAVKLDHLVTPPIVLDLSDLIASYTVQEGQHKKTEARLTAKENQMVNDLVSMGFVRSHAMKALKVTKSVSLEHAIDWLMSNSYKQDDDVEVEIDKISDSSIEMLTSMGFSRDVSIKALHLKAGKPEAAIDYLLSNIDRLELDYDKLKKTDTPPVTLISPDNAKYELTAFISHIGSFCTSGHYVCHIYRDDQWVVYNDEHVAESIEPPFDRGYLYFYRRKEN